MNRLEVPRILELTPALSPMYRLQYECVQGSWVLLYPDGMVQLNGPASEILRLCDGQRSVLQIVDELQQRFGESDLRSEVCNFVGDAHERGWIA